MDSLTQIALGAAVGVAVMGRRTAVWKAALWGAVCGTLPDLDAFIDHGDPILDMTRTAPFNIVLWRLVATTPTQYFEGYYSLLNASPAIRWTAHDRGAALIEKHGNAPSMARIAAFSHGFYRLSESGGRLFVTDLRMGMEPHYTFHFDLGPAASLATGRATPTLRSQRPDIPATLQWLWRRIGGQAVSPPA